MRNPSIPIILLLLCLAGARGTQAQGSIEGLWYDRLHSGHGLDLQRARDVLFGRFHTYDATGKTQWLWIQTQNTNAPSGALTRFRRSASGLVASAAGTVSLNPVSSCPDGVARPGARALLRVDFVLDGQAATWCMEPTLPATLEPHSVLDGSWHDPSEPGWGVTAHYYTGADRAAQYFHTVYYHDPAGEPRWAYAQGAVSSLTQTQSLFAPFVECFGCPATSSQAPAGTLALTLTQAKASPDSSRNRVLMSVGTGGAARFARDRPLALLSDARRIAGAANTSEGPVRGLSLSNGLTNFRALPYAAAPIGEARWREPTPAPQRTAMFDATEFGPGCPQPAGQGFFTGAPRVQSEDCLQLNVWTPQTAGPHPVMLWIHGGGLTQGSAVERIADQLVYDGAAFAGRDVVLVSINYRLGPLGYLAQRDLAAESMPSLAGNYGLMDQIAALQWVQNNIGAFGGDPMQVTIFGESAGGVSVCTLLAAPSPRGLFSRAIVQSGNCLLNPVGISNALAQGDRVTTAAGCADAANKPTCLRNLSVAALLAASRPTIGNGTGAVNGESFGLTLDGTMLPMSPGSAISSGNAAPVPLMIGVNDDEHTTLAPAETLPSSVAGYEAAIRANFGAAANAILQRYPASAYESTQRAYQDFLDDIRFTCATRRAAADHATRGYPVFHYVLTQTLPDASLAALESFHGLDIPLLFGPRSNAQAAERAIGLSMRNAWIDFARGLVPGQTDSAAWPAYSATTRQSQELNSARQSPISDYHGNNCAFLNLIVPL